MDAAKRATALTDLASAIAAATDVGLFDELAVVPNASFAINQFCDLILDAVVGAVPQGARLRDAAGNDNEAIS